MKNLFIERFKELLLTTKTEQKTLAKQMRRSQSLIINWKTGRSEPCIDDLIFLADYFNVCIDYLVGRQEYY